MGFLYALTALLPILAVATWLDHRRRNRHMPLSEALVRLRKIVNEDPLPAPKFKSKACVKGEPGISVPAKPSKKVAVIRGRR